MIENNPKAESEALNDKNSIFGTVESELSKGNGILLSKKIVLTSSKLIYNRQTTKNAIAVKFSLNSIRSSAFAYEAYD